jgi:ribA/ribD-fused uncharacterized protein
MMHQKALLFSDHETAAEILRETDPGKTQALGRQVKNFNKAVWVQHRERIVEEGSYHKFVNSVVEEDIKALFLATGFREASPYDKI